MNIKDWRGIRGLVAAELLTDTAKAITWGTPFPVCAVSKLTKTTDASHASKYYSNRAAMHRRSRGADEVSIDGSGISDATRARIMGEVYDEALGMYVAGNPGVRMLALGYIIKDTNGVEWGVWRLKGAMSYPETEHNTEDDGTDSAGETLTYTGQHTVHKFKHRGKPAKAVRIPLAAFPGGEAAFFAKVQTPDTVAAAMTGGDVPDTPDKPDAADLYLYGSPSESGNIGLRSGDTVTYYSGRVYSSLPDWWNKETHPYAFLCLGFPDGFDAWNVEVVVDADSIDGGFAGYGPAHEEGTVLSSDRLFDEWLEMTSITYAAGHINRRAPFWGNTDLYTTEGELYLAASEPIPVGEIVDTIDGIPIYEDLR